ncbi:MAG: ATP-binding protein [Candidatus Sumerlaeia bacterium]
MRSIALKFFLVVAVLALLFGGLGMALTWQRVHQQAMQQLEGRANVLQLIERRLDHTIKEHIKDEVGVEVVDAITSDFVEDLEGHSCKRSSIGIIRFQLSPRDLVGITGDEGRQALDTLLDTSSTATSWTGRLTIEGRPCIAMVLPCAIQGPGHSERRVDLLGVPMQSLRHQFMREISHQALVGAAGLILLLALIFGAFHRLVSRRLGAIADHFTALAANPDNPHEPLPVDTNDEIGRIASSFNVLNQILRDGRDRLDATVQQRTADLARSNEELKRLATAVGQAAEAILIADHSGTIQYVNPAFTRSTGFTQADAIGQTPRITQSDRYPDSFYTEIWKAVQAGQIWSGRMTCRRKDGSLFEQVTTISPVRDSEGRFDGMVALGRDISNEIALEQQLRQSQKMEAIGRLAGGIAHDFNNLLTVINGYSELLMARLGREHPLAKDVQEIKRAGERAGSMTRQLLAFSRRQVLQPRVIDLNSLIREMENMLRRLISEDVELVISLDEGLGRIMADPGQIEQVILNLAVNARDAMPEGGRLVLGTTNMDLDSGRFVALSIADTGHGMTEETLAHIFEPFFTTKEMGKGTGLGLSTVYGIVKQSGGDIRASSRLGRGTTFQVLLPRLPSADPSEMHEPPVPEAVGGRETILLVEDDDLIRELIKTLLRRNGYNPLVARDGVEAVEIYRDNKGRIDLVMTDLIMPRLGGRGLIERLNEEHGAVRALFMSGYTDNEVLRRGGLSDGSLFLGKPFAAHEMLAKIRQALN